MEPGFHYDKEPDLSKRIGEQRFPTRAEALEQHLKLQQPEDCLIDGRDAPYAGEYLSIGMITFTIGIPACDGCAIGKWQFHVPDGASVACIGEQWRQDAYVHREAGLEPLWTT